MCDLPIDIVNDEKIVRAVISPCHIKKNGKLKPAAFRSKPGTDEVSVIRQTHMGSDFCKAKARDIANGSPVNEYAGLAVMTAETIRALGSEVHDSRVEFCGHAHISHGIVVPPDEPPESDTFVLVTERCRDFVNSAAYHPDPSPDSDVWMGPVI